MREVRLADFSVSKYSVTIGRIKLPGMGSDPNTWCAAGIRCTQASAGDFLDVCFLPQGVALRPNTSVGPWHTSYRPISELHNYIDLLRNEGPLNMALDPARPEQHGIHTAGSEAVGEGE
jgi:hypothetical protein